MIRKTSKYLGQGEGFILPCIVEYKNAQPPGIHLDEGNFTNVLQFRHRRLNNLHAKGEIIFRLTNNRFQRNTYVRYTFCDSSVSLSIRVEFYNQLEETKGKAGHEPCLSCLCNKLTPSYSKEIPKKLKLSVSCHHCF